MMDGPVVHVPTLTLYLLGVGSVQIYIWTHHWLRTKVRYRIFDRHQPGFSASHFSPGCNHQIGAYLFIEGMYGTLWCKITHGYQYFVGSRYCFTPPRIWDISSFTYLALRPQGRDQEVEVPRDLL